MVKLTLTRPSAASAGAASRTQALRHAGLASYVDGCSSVNLDDIIPPLISTKSIFRSEESGKTISLFVEGVREFCEKPFYSGFS